jgi:Holliday junction DNA helicase RuvB
MPKPAAKPAPATPPADARGLGYLASALATPVSSAEAALRPLSFADFVG